MAEIDINETVEEISLEDGDEFEENKAQILDSLSDSLDADLYVYSGSIERELADRFLNEVEISKSRPNAALVLCTYGGDPDAAYIIARFLKSHYEKITLYVFGFCKSAGTIIALGADEIVISRRGELGPLDVQALKRDDLIYRSSGLDITQALISLSERTYEVFIDHFYKSIYSTKGAITTKTAIEIATALSVGLISPITAQVDPLRVGEIERAMTIAFQYGVRLNGNEERVNRLIRNYPSHSFVIDYAEAKEIFGNVRQPNELEDCFEMVLKVLENEEEAILISHPNKEGLIGCLKQEKKDETTDSSDEQQQTREESSKESRTVKQGANTKARGKANSESAKENENGTNPATAKAETG